jgi:type II secretory pathway component GspD/PulD (secretin)
MKRQRSLPAFLLLGIAMTAGGQQPAAGDTPAVDFYALINRLAVELNKEFILDPRLQGMQWSSTAGNGADYDSLLALLRSAGYAAIEVGDQIRIVHEATARSEPSPLVQADDPRISDHAIVTRVITVPATQVAAAELVPVLRPLMSAAVGNAAAIPGTNTLVIVDRYDNVRRITAIIDELRQ